MTVEPAHEQASRKYDQFKRLKLIKRLLLYGSALGFSVFNRKDVYNAIEYIWSCYVAKTHDQPYDTLIWHYSYAVVEMGATLANFVFLMMGAYFSYLIIWIIWQPEDCDEIQLEYRRSEAEKSYRQLVREDRIYETAENVLKQNIELRSQLDSVNDELLKLQDRLIRIKFETYAIESNQRGKRAGKRAAATSLDLFDAKPHTPKPCDQSQARAIKKKWRISKRRRSAPEF